MNRNTHDNCCDTHGDDYGLPKAKSQKPKAFSDISTNYKEVKQTCAVIGSGIGGISSAIRLANKGYKVTVFEQSSKAGGKISETRQGRFRFDTGPSLFTLPDLVDELFVLCGKDPRNYFNYIPLKESCNYFWEDGTNIKAWGDAGLFARELQEKTGIEPSKTVSFLRKCRELYALTAEVFMFNSFHRPSNFMKPAYRRSLRYLYKLDAFTTMHKRNKKWFNHSKITQLFDRYATYNGSSPYKTPATLNVIAHLEHNLGAWFPSGGMYDIAASLQKLAEDVGVEFKFNTRVEEIVFQDTTGNASTGQPHPKKKRRLWPLTAKKEVAGLRTNGELHAFDLVVSDVDVVNFYRNLLPDETIPSKQIKQQRSSSALIFYWSINGRFEKLGLHNILFSDDYKLEFDHLFETKTIAKDPSVYIFISSRVVPSDAPEGAENWYVMINAPENIGQDWDTLIQEARTHIIRKINAVLKTDIEKYLVAETLADPRTIERDTASTNGSLYGLSSNGLFSAFNRHPNFKSKYKNLYFVGGSVHPGGGIPLCLASAKIIDQEIPTAKPKPSL
jgi:phytoene desaturase